MKNFSDRLTARPNPIRSDWSRHPMIALLDAQRDPDHEPRATFTPAAARELSRLRLGWSRLSKSARRAEVKWWMHLFRREGPQSGPLRISLFEER